MNEYKSNINISCPLISKDHLSSHSDLLSFSHYAITLAAGIPVYSPGVRRPLSDVLQPLEETPLSKISREPWWWRYPSLRPHMEQRKAKPSHLRDSYLSPVKNTFRWYEHPFRHFGK
jgi:hypothetical protein